MKRNNRIKRLLATMVAAVLLASMLGIPSFAANERVYYTLEPSTQTPEIGTIFYVTLKLKATRTGGDFNIPFLRFNLHYDPTFFEPLGYNGKEQLLSAWDTDEDQPSYIRYNGLDIPEDGETSGRFTVTDLTGVSKAYPVSGAAGLNVLVVQWIAPVRDGAVQVLNNLSVEGDDGNGTVVLRFYFRCLENAPLDGSSGTIAIFKNYSAENMPFYMQLLPDPTQYEPTDYFDYTPTSYNPDASTFPINVSKANLSLTPSPHAPALVAKPGALIKEFTPEQQAQYGYSGIIYGFPDSMTVEGTTNRWDDPQYAAQGADGAEWLYADQIDNLIGTTNMGVLHVSNNGKPEHKWDYGTGTTLTLYNSSKSEAVGKYYFVVFGDVDGNFIINLDDYVEAKAMLAGQREDKVPTGSVDPYDTPYYMAAHIIGTSSPGPLAEAVALKIYYTVFGLDSIDQRPTLPS